jgi:hypothetical protein
MAASAKTLTTPKSRPKSPAVKARAPVGFGHRVVTGSIDIAAPTGGSSVGLTFTAAGTFSLTPSGTNPVVVCTFTLIGGNPIVQQATLNTQAGTWETTFVCTAGGVGNLKAELFDGTTPVDSDLAPGIRVLLNSGISADRITPDKPGRWGNSRGYTVKGTVAAEVCWKPRCQLVGKRKVLFADEVKVSNGKWSATFNHVPKGGWVVVATAQTDTAVFCDSRKLDVE